MSDQPQKAQPGARTYQFTVYRGMTPVLLIETTVWYLGLLQAAVARIQVEGQN